MNNYCTPPHTPFSVTNPIAADPDAWEREVVLPLRAAELGTRSHELQTALDNPALSMGERASLKRQINDLHRRIDAMGLNPAHV